MPTCFPSVYGYVDGGVFTTNPSMCALAQTQDCRYDPTPALYAVYLLSPGTGKSRQYIKGETLDWGEARWVKPLISLMLEGTAGVADYQCRQIMGERCHRFTPVFPAGNTVAVDAVDKIAFMTAFAESLNINELTAWLQTQWMPA